MIPVWSGSSIETLNELEYIPHSMNFRTVYRLQYAFSVRSPSGSARVSPILGSVNCFSRASELWGQLPNEVSYHFSIPLIRCLWSSEAHWLQSCHILLPRRGTECKKRPEFKSFGLWVSQLTCRPTESTCVNIKQEVVSSEGVDPCMCDGSTEHRALFFHWRKLCSLYPADRYVVLIF